MTIRELQSILRKYREQQQQSAEIQIVTPDEVRARQLLRDLIEINNRAFNKRKEGWFRKHPKKVFEPTLEEVFKDITLDEWFLYFVNRIATTPHERYHDVIAVGGPEEEAEEEKNKTTLEILMDYRNYQDFDLVLKIWTECR